MAALYSARVVHCGRDGSSSPSRSRARVVLRRARSAASSSSSHTGVGMAMVLSSSGSSSGSAGGRDGRHRDGVRVDDRQVHGRGPVGGVGRAVGGGQRGQRGRGRHRLDAGEGAGGIQAAHALGGVRGPDDGTASGPLELGRGGRRAPGVAPPARRDGAVRGRAARGGARPGWRWPAGAAQVAAAGPGPGRGRPAGAVPAAGVASRRSRRRSGVASVDPAARATAWSELSGLPCSSRSCSSPVAMACRRASSSSWRRRSSLRRQRLPRALGLGGGDPLGLPPSAPLPQPAGLGARLLAHFAASTMRGATSARVAATSRSIVCRPTPVAVLGQVQPVLGDVLHDAVGHEVPHRLARPGPGPGTRWRRWPWP